MKPKYSIPLALFLIFTVVELSTGQVRRQDVPTLWEVDTVTYPAQKGNVANAQPVSPCDTAKTAFPAFVDTMEMKVGDLKSYGESQYIVELSPKKNASNFVLPVVIGSCEMNGIYSATHNETSPRPMTYDLMTTVLKQTGVKLRGIVITKLQDGVFYAVLLIENQCQCQKLAIDARPSDAINLALRNNAKIYAERKVWNEAKEER